jgi:hypothetical protein
VFLARGEGSVYRGAIVEITPNFAIQKVGENVVLHRLKDLEANIPDTQLIHEGEKVSIAKGAQGAVTIEPWDGAREEKERERGGLSW